MIGTMDIYETRKIEIELMYSVIVEIDNGNILTQDNQNTRRILMSNLVLMLYNLVEACIISGLDEIYKEIKNNPYSKLTDDIQKIWLNCEIDKLFDSGAGRVAYENKVQEILRNVIANQPVSIDINVVKRRFGGSLNADTIKKICDNHGIR
jgi:hypothetical protein